MLGLRHQRCTPGTVMSADDAAYAWVGEEGGDALGYGVDAMGD